MKKVFKKILLVTVVSLLIIFVGNTIYYLWLSSSDAFKELKETIYTQKQFTTKATDNHEKEPIKLVYFSVNKFLWLGKKSVLNFAIIIDSRKYRVEMVKIQGQNWHVVKIDAIE